MVGMGGTGWRMKEDGRRERGDGTWWVLVAIDGLSTDASLRLRVTGRG
jgi:hypothetical protein